MGDTELLLGLGITEKLVMGFTSKSETFRMGCVNGRRWLEMAKIDGDFHVSQHPADTQNRKIICGK